MFALIRFVCALALALAPALSFGQPAKSSSPHRIGVLYPGPAGGPSNMDALYQGLRDLGYIEGQNLVIERRYGDGREDRLPAIAAELAQLKVDVIVAMGPASTRAARQATSTIPIVMSTLDAVEQGLVASLGRPGGNITGWSVRSSESGGKQLQMLKEAMPKITSVAVISNPAMPGHANLMRRLNDDAKAQGLRLYPLDVDGPGALAGAFAAMRQSRVDAFFVIPDTVIDPLRDRIIALAAEHRLAGMYGWRFYVDAGGLMSYGPNLPALIRRLAYYVHRILSGANPADVPVEEPDRYELVLNLKTARALGITFPMSLRLRAEPPVE